MREWSTDDRTGTNVEIDADALGHDLSWGTSVFTRSVASTVAHDADLPSDRPAVLEDGAGEEAASGEVTDAEGEAVTERPREAALPF